MAKLMRSIRNKQVNYNNVVCCVIFLVCVVIYVKTSEGENNLTNREVKSRAEVTIEKAVKPEEEVQTTATTIPTTTKPIVFEKIELIPFLTTNIKFCEDVFPNAKTQRRMLDEFDDVWLEVGKHDDYVTQLRLSLKHVEGKCYVGHTLSYIEEAYVIAKLIK